MMLKPVSSLVLASVAAVALAGCGSHVSPTSAAIASSAKAPSALSVSTGTTASTVTAQDTTPTAGSSQLAATTGTPGLGVSDPATSGAPTLADITATVSTKKNGLILGMGTFKCTVEVTNPSSVPRYGTLTATFMAGSKQSKTDPVVIPLTLGANETRSYDLSDPKWTTNDVQLQVTTKPYAAATATAAQ